MADFDWLTEDEKGLPSETGEEEPKNERPSWHYPLIILVVLAMSAAVLYAT